MTQTKAADLLNPEVLADIVAGKLPKAIRFAPYAKVDTTLEGVAGDTITRPVYGYVGAAEDLTEGVPMDPAKLSMTTTQVTVKEAGKAIEVTEKAIITNVAGTMDEAANQITKAMADKLDIDYLASMAATLLSHDAAPVTATAIIDAINLFGDEDEETYILFINPKDYTGLSKSLIDGNTFLSQAQIAELVGVKEIVKTNRLVQGTAYVQKAGAVEIVYKKRPNIEKDHDILARTFVLAGNNYYTTNLYNANGVVKIVDSI
ncbi:N4-gp56 family major capsid protein [Neobacillus sp. 3P2-tot-E-2]|uniref:N4-gp56 family major capsid protein n=1 Tax=Neobacillus sp. 3P2-tot-E-2 TaxID=3132212 RepID=UPI00399FE19F